MDLLATSRRVSHKFRHNPFISASYSTSTCCSRFEYVDSRCCVTSTLSTGEHGACVTTLTTPAFRDVLRFVYRVCILLFIVLRRSKQVLRHIQSLMAFVFGVRSNVISSKHHQTRYILQAKILSDYHCTACGNHW